jgi:hypothetical protein
VPTSQPRIIRNMACRKRCCHWRIALDRLQAIGSLLP